jgi:hypothetical protein
MQLLSIGLEDSIYYRQNKMPLILSSLLKVQVDYCNDNINRHYTLFQMLNQTTLDIA